MTQQAWTADDFQSLTPAVDPRRSTKFFALSGRNYVFDSIGIKSPFGSRLLVPEPIGNPAHVQSFRIHLRTGDRVFRMVSDAILEWDEANGGWQIIYITPDTSVAPNRWTFGYLNGFVYFCHPRVGLLAYNVDTGVCARVTSAGTPDNPIACCVSNGILCVINQEYMLWSAQSNGQDWAPRLAGPGFQLINDRVAGDPITITAYAGGTLTWTTGGVMRSQFTADQAVFQHRALNTEFQPINSFCTIKTDEDTTVILDRRGLFSCDGNLPQPYAPLFNEYLIGLIERNPELWQKQNLRLEWDELQRRLYLSYSFSEVDALYEQAFVYYPPLDKWGQFNESHYGLGPEKINFGSRSNDFYSYVGADARVNLFLSTGSREGNPVDPTTDWYYPRLDKPPYQPEGDSGQVLSSSMVMSTIPTLPLVGTRAGFIPSGGGMRVIGPLTGLDAQIRLGLLRFPLSTANDQVNEVVQLFVGSAKSRETDGPTTDWNLIPPGVTNEDWNVVAAAEEFGLSIVDYINSSTRIIGTRDGKTEFYSEIPELVEFNRDGRYYSCCVPGVWHIFEMNATVVGEGFHLSTFELTGVPQGRLS